MADRLHVVIGLVAGDGSLKVGVLGDAAAGVPGVGVAPALVAREEAGEELGD